MRPFSILSFFFLMGCSFIQHAQFTNVRIAKTAPAKTLWISIDPKDPKHIKAACNSGLYLTNDSGRLWRRSDQKTANEHFEAFKNPMDLLKNDSAVACEGPNDEIYTVRVASGNLRFKGWGEKKKSDPEKII